jgi:transposase InsO family protein
MWMAGEVVSMKSRLIAAVSGDVAGLNVSRLCEELGISRKTFYKWRRRFAVEGLEGLQPRSKRPLRSPSAIPFVVQDRIVELRKELADSGWDAGPRSIRDYLLAEAGAWSDAVPSEATIWRILVRRGFVVPAPAKRPRSSYVRFEADAPNERWQIDATHWLLANGTEIELINIIDDHSRVVTCSQAVPVCTTEAAWTAFSAAVARWGLPIQCLSDNGLAFTGRLKGFEVGFETNLRAAGVAKINSRPYHPQTCGKVERFQQTLKKWLSRQPTADTITTVQHQLDQFSHHYNHHRPHQGISRATPIERFTATTRVQPHQPDLPPPPRRSTHRVAANGNVMVSPYEIGLGTTHQGKTATVIIDNGFTTVIIDNHLIRHLKLNPNRRYQPTGKPPGRPKRPTP